MSIFKPKTLEPTSIPDPMFLDIALKEIGVKEIPGKGHNSKIVEYHSHTKLKATEDEVPWCSSFVNYCIDKAGYRGTGSAMARSWLNWGHPSAFRRGAIVIFERGNPPNGHVALCLRDLGNEIEVVGGNQSDSVCIARYPKSRVLGYRWVV